MPREGYTIYDILLSCPSDVADLKNIVEECISDFNKMYGNINNIKLELMKDNLVRKSLFTQIIEALDNNELELASELQLIMKDKMELLQSKYIQYKKNIF